MRHQCLLSEEQSAEEIPSPVCSAAVCAPLVTELTRITDTLSRMCGDGDTRGRHVLHRCLETSENMDSRALAIVGASDWRACIHLAAQGRVQAEE